MNESHKRMIVILFSIAFVASMAIIILSSIATAATDWADYDFSADGAINRQNTLIDGWSDEDTSIQDMQQRYDDRMAKEDREKEMREYMNRPALMGGSENPVPRMVYVCGEQSGQYESDYSNGYDTDFSDRITTGIYALIIIAIIAFILYGVGGWIEEKTTSTEMHHYIDMDAPAAQPYDRQAAQKEIDKGRK